jgi:cytoskeletal protein RodZ
MATPASDSSHTNLHDTPTTTKADESGALGNLLRESRERRGMSLEQISNETKIPLRQLQALERDDVTVVPEGLYRRLKIRAYARALHFDQDALAHLEHLLRSTEPPPAPLVVSDTATDETTPLEKGVLMVLAAIGAVLLMGWAMRGGEDSGPGVPQPKSAKPAQLQQTTPAEEEEATTPEPGTVGDSAVATVGSPEPQPAPASTSAETEPRVVQSQTTELLITSDPPGARVTVDGIGWGSTPVTIRHVSPGIRHIRVTKDGYQSEERAANVAGDRLNALHVSMQAVP